MRSPLSKQMKGFRLTAFWQAVLVIVVAYLVYASAFPPLMPRSVMIIFMTITIIGVLLYFSFDDERWAEFKAPVLAVLRQDRLKVIRWAFMVLIPSLAAYAVYAGVRPSLEPPVELRQVHPAPPSSLRVYDKNHDLTILENPVRMKVLETLKTDLAKAREAYIAAVKAGRDVYFQNCFYCHGDHLDGQGPFAEGFVPRPANFQDVGTIAQLQEGFLFWRITTGGPGLPKEGAPWSSGMPAWHEMLNEEDVWNVIMFLYDYVGQVPRMWNQEVSKAVTGLNDEIQAQRVKLSATESYQFRCAVCHGEEGAGDGPAAEFLYPKPRDFTLGLFKYKTSPGTLPPRDEDLVTAIKHGLEGTGMPGWKAVLSDDEIKALIAVVKGFDITATWAPEDAPDDAFDDAGRYVKKDVRVITESEAVDGQVPYSLESVARGKIVFEENCIECHGQEGRGNITSAKRLKDDWGERIWPRDLTKPWTWRVTNVVSEDTGSRDEIIRKIYQRLTIGIPGTPMPAHRAVEEGDEDPVTLEDRWHVANYAYSLREKTTPPSDTPIITALKLAGPLPASLDDAAWKTAPATTLSLVPNVIKTDRLFTPLADAVTVRVVYNETDIAFLLEIDDRTDSRPGEKQSEQLQDKRLKMYSDALAIQFPKQGAYVVTPVVEKPLFRHGDATHPTTIWYWNAGSIQPPLAANLAVLDATGADKKLVPRDGDIGVVARGKWDDGRWRVLMQRSRDAANPDDLQFSEGEYIPVSFANWDGSNGEVGSKHTLTTWYWLLLPPETNVAKVYGVPAGSGVLVFLAGLAVVRRQRAKA